MKERELKKLDATSDDYKQIFDGKPSQITPKAEGLSDTPNGEKMDASTSLREDLWLYIRNRIKRQASGEGQGIDTGSLIPAISKIVGFATSISTSGPFIIGGILLLALLFLLLR